MTRFIDEIVLPRRNPLPGLPPEYRADPSCSDEWSDWKIFESSVTDDDWSQLEREAGFRLPTLLQEYYRYKVIMDGDFGLVRLADMRPDTPLRELAANLRMLHQEDCLKRSSLAPFAEDGNDGGPICFKFDQPTEDGDYPIYFVEHGLMRDPSYRGERRWGSFAELIDEIEKNFLAYD